MYKRQVYQVQSVYGYISFTVSATKTLREWVASEEHEFTATSVEIKGQLLHHSNGEYYERPSNNRQPYWDIYDDATRRYVDISDFLTLSDTPISQDNLSYEFYLKIPESVFKPTMSVITVGYDGARTTSSYDWEDLMNTTQLIWDYPLIWF